MKSLFTPEVHQEVISRMQKLEANSQPTWGKMDVAQMCTHCQAPLEVAMQKMTLGKQNVGFFKRMIFRVFKSSMYNDKPWQKNLPTVREFRITDERTFTAERDKLIAVTNEFHEYKDKSNWPPHPMFGTFTTEQWGKMQYKHLDHHLTQFGV